MLCPSFCSSRPSPLFTVAVDRLSPWNSFVMLCAVHHAPLASHLRCRTRETGEPRALYLLICRTPAPGSCFLSR
jgi:hypothetical protein